MRAPELSTSETEDDKARLAESIRDAVQRADELGFGEAGRLLRLAHRVAEKAAIADRAGSMN